MNRRCPCRPEDEKAVVACGEVERDTGVASAVMSTPDAPDRGVAVGARDDRRHVQTGPACKSQAVKSDGLIVSARAVRGDRADDSAKADRPIHIIYGSHRRRRGGGSQRRRRQAEQSADDPCADSSSRYPPCTPALRRLSRVIIHCPSSGQAPWRVQSLGRPRAARRVRSGAAGSPRVNASQRSTAQAFAKSVLWFSLRLTDGHSLRLRLAAPRAASGPRADRPSPGKARMRKA